jgi:Aminotransferase class-III
MSHAVDATLSAAPPRPAVTDHLLLHFARNGSLRERDQDILVLERGEGVYVYDTEGRRYLDALSCLFCSQIGYSYGREMAEAASAQLERLAFNTNWGTAHPAAIELAERLAALAPPEINKVFFTSGGSESVEAAWKLARQYHLAHGQPQRTKAIADLAVEILLCRRHARIPELHERERTGGRGRTTKPGRLSGTNLRDMRDRVLVLVALARGRAFQFQGSGTHSLESRVRRFRSAEEQH